ncbi:MAG: DUF4831 family protein [Alistipes sp.]|jgi:hypothetical protein|nr:DUF4831 family protein [Alistipes sp.]
MKRLLLLITLLGSVALASAQPTSRKGAYFVDGQLVLSQPKSSLAVVLTTETERFTPGQFARYAQKYLGVRASLSERVASSIVAAEILAEMPTAKAVDEVVESASEQSVLPIYRSDNGALSVEQQAAKAAEMIYALRKQRRELIAGDIGEHVFGAGLKAALDEIARMEAECLSLFYGTTERRRQQYRFAIAPSADAPTSVLCRFRDDSGVLPIADLSGEAVVLNITPSAVDLSGITPATAKDKVVWEYAVAAPCRCVLTCGNTDLATVELPLYQFGRTITVAAPR